MSDPTTPVSDPVEDLVRRTFAVRAEDMAPGDGADEPPLPRAGRRPGRAPGRAVLAAAIVIVVAALAATVAIVASDGGDDSDTTGRLAAGGTGSLADVAAASDRLTTALQDERNLAAITLIGQESLIDVPVTDTTQARLATDTAVDDFTDSVDASPDAALYQPAIDALAGLDDVRRQVDGFTGPMDMRNIEGSDEVFEAYGSIVRGLLAGQRAVVDTIDDPAVRDGASAYLWGLELSDRTSALVRAALMIAVRPGTEATTELAALHSDLQQGLDDLAEETAGTPYEDAAATAIAEVEESGLLELTAAALAGRPDIAAILAAVELDEDEGWPAYLDRVGAIVAEKT